VVLGVYPKPVLAIINPAVHQTLVQVHSTDPVPPHPGTQSTATRTAAARARSAGRTTQAPAHTATALTQRSAP